MSECPICAEKFTTQLRKAVKCPYCEFSSCIQCNKRYLTETTKDPHCMNTDCNVGWNNDFMTETFTKSWYNGAYQQHRKEILFSREEARLQETMELVQFLQDVYEYYDNSMEFTDIELVKTNYITKRLDDKLSRCNDQTTRNEIQKQIQESTTTHNKLMRRKDLLDTLTRRAMVVVWGTPQVENEMLNIQNVVYNNLDVLNNQQEGGLTTVQRKQFTMPCPKANCLGFLSQRYKCSLCEVYVCHQCHELKKGDVDNDHICNHDVVKSVQLIKRDSKSCPSCHSLIHRYAGCPQMWCTVCKVAFDWRTGRIDNGPVHNPHYAEWLQRNNPQRLAGRMLAIRACGADISQDRMLHMFHRLNITREFAFYNLVYFIGTIHHFDQVELHQLRTKVNGSMMLDRYKRNLGFSRIVANWSFDDQLGRRRELLAPTEDPNRRFRLLYILGAFEKDVAKTLLQKQEKSRFQATAWYNLYDMFTNTSKDLLVQLESFLVENRGNQQLCIQEIERCYNEIVKLCQYLNFHSSSLHRQQNKTSQILYITRFLQHKKSYTFRCQSLEDPLTAQ